jgi:hypothetical protein
MRLGRFGTRGRAPGNRAVSRFVILDARFEACPVEEGAPWRKHGFPRESEAEPSDG